MRLVTTVMSALLFAGCYDPGGARSAFRGLGDDTPTAPAPVPRATAPSSRAGVTQPGSSLAGTLGSVRGFSADGVEVRVEGSGNVIQLDAVNTSARWWVMTRFNLSRPLTDPAWAPGSVHTITPGGSSLVASTLSCSGPTRGNYTFDASPSRITMHVEEGSTPGSRVVSFAEYWDNGGHVVTGTFEYLPR